MKKKESQSEVLLSLSDEIIRIRGKQDMLNIILHTLKKYIQFQDSFILRYDREKRSCWPYIYYSEQARSKHPHYKTYLGLEYHIADDTVDDINYPQVYEVETLLPLGTEQIEFMHNSGIKEFAVIKLIEGNQMQGLFILLSEQTNSFKPEDLDLLHRISYQLSTATTNIIAKEEIAKKEEENTILLSLSTEISGLKNRNDLIQTVNKSIKKIFSITEFAIAKIDEDPSTYSAFMMDLEDRITSDIDFKESTSEHYSINDALFNAVINSEDPLIFQVSEIVDTPGMPSFVHFWRKLGLQRVLCAALKAGGRNIGMAVLHLDIDNPINPTGNLLKGVCAQLSVAVSNIIAHEKIKKAEEEKSLLLSFSNDIATVRDKEGLRLIIKQYLKNIFHIREYIITTRNNDGETYSLFLHDSQADDPDDEGWKIMMSNRIPVKGAFIGAVLQSEEAVFVIEEILREKKFYFPAASFWKAAGAKKVMGFRLMFADKDIGLLVIQPGQVNNQLLKGISAQLAIAIANIVAIEEIIGREKEKSILLSLTSEIAAVTNKNELLELLNDKLKNLFPIKGFGITLINEDGKTHSPFVVDVQEELKRDNYFKEAISQIYSVTDGVFNVFISADDPVTLEVNELAQMAEAPGYVDFWVKMEIKKVIGIAVRVSEKNLGCFIILQDSLSNDGVSDNLLKGVSAQISIAISNIRAIEEIIKREEEKSTLLSISQEIAVLRNRNDLFEVVIKKMKELFSINEFGIGYINDNDETYSSFTIDRTTATKNHEDFDLIVSSKYSIHDPIFSKVMNAEEPVDFDINDLSKQLGVPPYVNFWKVVGFQKVLCVALRVGRKNIGCAFLHFDSNPSIHKQINLVKGVCSQLSVAISNILASENIETRENERELLLSLNLDIAGVRNNQELLSVIDKKLKTLLGFSDTVISMINDDKKTARVVLLDLKLKSKNQPDYLKTNSYPIADVVLPEVLNSPSPFVYDLKELGRNRDMPIYLKVGFKGEMEQAVMVRFSKGESILGVWVIVYKKKAILNNSQLVLIEGLANQISIALSNIIANNEIQEREKEKSMLLEFSNSIASVRDKGSLSKILNREIKELLGIKEYAIHVLSEDKKTHRPVFYDPEAEFARHPAFLTLVTQQTDVNDGIFNTILNSDEPITFDAEQWITLKKPPLYAHAAIDIGLKKLTGVRIHLGEENIAVLNFRHDDINMAPKQYPLLKSLCSQIAIAIANIIANEKVSNQLNAINKYKQQLEEEKIYLREEIETAQNFSEMIGESAEMKKVFRLVEKVASSESTVLLLGETRNRKRIDSKGHS